MYYNMTIKNNAKTIFEFFFNMGVDFDDYDSVAAMDEDNFDFSNVCALDTFYICFQNAKSDDCEISYAKLEEFYNNLINEEKTEDLYVLFNSKCLYRIDCHDSEFIDTLLSENNSSIESSRFEFKSDQYEINFGVGISELNFIDKIHGNYSKYYPPYEDTDIYISLNGNGVEKLEKKELIGIVEAYLFQIKCSYDIDVFLSPRENGEYEFLYEEGIQLINPMRPLLLGDGIFDVLSLFNIASQTADLNTKVINYTKILEYISLTVVNGNLIDKVMNKLRSKRVFSPDSNYIVEMGDIFLSNDKISKNDGALIKEVITNCCDVFELKNAAPQYMKKISKLDKGTKDEQKVEALNEVADYIVNTRNRVSHSKPNYQGRGKISANDEQLSELLELLKMICEQSIRWFGNIPEKDRVTIANSYR